MPNKAPPNASAQPKQPSQSEIDSTARMLMQTMDLVRLQMRRIKKDVEFHEEILAAGRQDQQVDSTTSLFADVHYLLISLHNVEQLFSRLKKLTPHEVELTDVRNKYRKWLGKCNEFRGRMDHSDSRNPMHPIDSGRLDGHAFCIDGVKIDIGPVQEKEIENMFNDLTTAWAKISDRQKKLRELITKHVESAS